MVFGPWPRAQGGRILMLLTSISIGAGVAVFVVVLELLHNVINNWPYRHKRPVSIKVTSDVTLITYHASALAITKDDTPYLRIYARDGSHEWWPIWRFKNPAVIMFALDPQWATAHVAYLCSQQYSTPDSRK